MKKTFTRIFFSNLFLIFLLLMHYKSAAQLNALSENFDAVVPAGWTSINHSTGGAHAQGWFQGDVRQFAAYSGIATSYAAANYLSINSPTGKGTINNWLITPELNLTNGSTITFFTRTVAGSTYPDRLEVRLSTKALSVNVGNGVDDTGDFSTLLLSVNPTLAKNGYPDTGWKMYSINLSGFNSSVAGRIAFRYYVTDAGSNGNNSNYIGIDNFSYQAVLPVTLLSFNGSIKDNKALLKWSTTNEINNKGFEVQVSHNYGDFTTIGFVAADAGKANIHQYNFTDNNLLSGANYYRLKQIDIDGVVKYSYVIQLDWKNFGWIILGNPYQGNTQIQLQTETRSNIAVQVISMSGQIIETINKGNLEAGTYNIPLNLANISHGMYIVRLVTDDNAYSKKIVR